MVIVRLIADDAAVAAVLERAGAAGTVARLASGAVEIAFAGGDAAKVRAAIEDGAPECDALVADHRPVLPALFVSDMDSTMIAAECIDELADFAGLKPQISEITERAMQGELDFASALRERVALLAGLPEAAIDECLATRIAPMPGARVLVETLKSLGCRTVLVTGGFHHFADPVADSLGFDEVIANRLAIAGGKLTGGLDGAIVDSASKRAALGEGGVTLATGDGANDIPMLDAATYGIAFHAKPKARAAANGWIGAGDLTSVLTLLGISRDEWVWE